jgi:parvulin-like peptidyl-prolyl isomerase
MARQDKLTTRTVLGIVGVTVVALAIAGILSSFGGIDSSDAAEVEGVGGISKQEFTHWYTVVASQPQPGQKKPKSPPSPDSKQGKALKQQVMQFLISADWIIGEAKDRGLTASDEEIKRQFDQTKKQSFPNDKAYQRFLKSSGQTVDDLLFRVKLDVLSNKIREQLTSASSQVSNDEIKAYYEKNSQQFSQPERRDLQVVLTKSEAKANEAKKRVESGDKWADVAKKLSDDPASKSQGGRLLGVSKGQQDPAFDAAIFSAVEKKIAGPVKTGAGFYVFRVTKVTKATKQSLQQSASGIRQLLISQNQQKKLDQFSKTFRNKWRANTDCAKEYVIADCRNGREEPQTTPPATTPGQKKPVAGASGANPPALDGTGSTLAGGNGAGPVIGTESSSASLGAGGFTGAGAAPSAPLALGGAPKKGAAAGSQTIPGGIVPGGGAPQGAPGGGAGGAGGGAGGTP